MKKLMLIFMFLFFFSSILYAGDCTEKFSWLPNSEHYLAGYKIYYGIVEGEYLYQTDVGKPETIDGRVHGEVSGLTCGEKYHFVGVAYNTSGIESEYSIKVIVDVVDRPEPPQDFRVTYLK